MTQTTPTIVGRIPNNRGKRPKISEETRICADAGCDTKLSRYNIHESCYLHRPLRYPRVRGRPA